MTTLPPIPRGTPSFAKLRVALRVVRYTEKAYLVSLPHGERQAWIPRSPDPAAMTCRAHEAGFECFNFALPLWLYRRLARELIDAT